MLSFCKVIIVGKLTEDPDIRFTQNGLRVSFVVNVRTPTKDPSKPKKDRFTVNLWNEKAKLYGGLLRKKTWVYLTGRLHRYKREDYAGNIWNSFVINADTIEIMSTTSQGCYGPPPAPTLESPLVSDLFTDIEWEA